MSKTCPQCSGPKHYDAALCRDCRYGDRKGSFVCPECGGHKTYTARRCSTCRLSEELITNHGYRLVRVPGGRRPEYEHRVVMERVLGRPLETWEHVHHINHNKLDNRPENLQVLTALEHRRLHGARTVCDHDRTPENTYVSPQGRRQCRICNHARASVVAARRKAERHARGLLRQRRG